MAQGPNTKKRKKLVKKLLRKSGGNCGICGKPVRKEDRSLDHKIPKVYFDRPGANYISNLQIAHKTCNNRKGDQLCPQT